MKNQLVISLLLISLAAFSQKPYPLKDIDDNIEFKVKVINQQLVLEQQGQTTLFSTKKDFPVINKVSLEESDIVLNYKAGRSGDLLRYTFSLALQLPDGTVMNAPESDLLYQPGPQGSQNLIWLNAVEMMADFEANYTLKVTRSLMGAVNCDAERPSLTAQTKILTYVGASVGLMSVVVGQVYLGEKKASYRQYQQLWSSGATRPGDTDNPLEKARNNDLNAKIFTWGGAGLVVASALFYKLKSDKVKRKQKHYDKFCNDAYRTSFHLTPSKTGVGLVLNF